MQIFKITISDLKSGTINEEFYSTYEKAKDYFDKKVDALPKEDLLVINDELVLFACGSLNYEISLKVIDVL